MYHRYIYCIFITENTSKSRSVKHTTPPTIKIIENCTEIEHYDRSTWMKVMWEQVPTTHLVGMHPFLAVGHHVVLSWKTTRRCSGRDVSQTSCSKWWPVIIMNMFCHRLFGLEVSPRYAATILKHIVKTQLRLISKLWSFFFHHVSHLISGQMSSEKMFTSKYKMKWWHIWKKRDDSVAKK